MFFGISRFLYKGWVQQLYIDPQYHFGYYGFEWVKPLEGSLMYIPFVLMIIASVFIIAGFLYRYTAFVFFICFTYVELLDKSNYLNHYYFVSLMSFLMILVPAKLQLLRRYWLAKVGLQLGLQRHSRLGATEHLGHAHATQAGGCRRHMSLVLHRHHPVHLQALSHQRLDAVRDGVAEDPHKLEARVGKVLGQAGAGRNGVDDCDDAVGVGWHRGSQIRRRCWW